LFDYDIRIVIEFMEPLLPVVLYLASVIYCTILSWIKLTFVHLRVQVQVWWKWLSDPCGCERRNTTVRHWYLCWSTKKFCDVVMWVEFF